MKDYLDIGKIIGAHGIRGEIKLFPYTDDLRRFSSLKSSFFSRKENITSPEKGPIEVEYARVHNDVVIVKFIGVDDRTDAEKLKGVFVSVSRKDAIALNPDEYYIADMIGLEVKDNNLGTLGKVYDVYETGSNFIIEVIRKGKPNLLVPFLKSCNVVFSMDEGFMTLDLPEGLFELYEPKEKT